MDRNANKRFDRKEWVSLGRKQGGSATFDLKITNTEGNRKPCSVTLVDIYVKVRANAVEGFQGSCAVACCHKGTVNGTTIRVLDDNLDGVITQDGQDSVVFGKSRFAMPLGKVHWISDAYYKLDVLDDGAGAGVAKLQNPTPARVEVPIKGSRLRHLYMISSEGDVCDFAAGVRRDVPAGRYRLAYGIVAKGKQAVVMEPDKRALEYEIEVGKVNRIRIGPPAKVQFSTEFAASERKFSVRPVFEIVGSGGEVYDLSYSGGLGRPRITIHSKTKKLLDAAMSFG